MDKNLNNILKKELENIKPSAQELLTISSLVDNFLTLIKPELKKNHADLIIGGSFSKNTIIRKDKYDIDFFITFEKNENISEILEKMLLKIVKRIKPSVELIKLKGSRDYFNLDLIKKPIPISFEIVPVLKIKNIKEAENVTDLSPFHVTYVKKYINKNKSLADEIRLVKAFSYAQKCYGAESYIRGFSGYALELLTCYYGSFLNLLKAASKWNLKQKIIIDPERYYKGKEALEKLNSAKLESPIILVDPTQPERNATAALSNECLEKFIGAGRKFLSNPSSKLFAVSLIDKEKMQEEADKKNAQLLIVNVKSNKKKDDVAGAKLKKFFLSFSSAMKEEFSVLKEEFVFDINGKKAEFFFIVKKDKKDVLIRGPPSSMPKAVDGFKKRWPKCFIKGRFVYAKRESKDIKEIIKELTKNKAELKKERGIESVILYHK